LSVRDQIDAGAFSIFLGLGDGRLDLSTGFATGGVVDNTVRTRFVVGRRTEYEAVRDDHERNRVPPVWR